jgi:hypothetical protein
MKTNKPETVQVLVKLVQQKYSLPQEEIMEHVINLQSQEKLILHEGYSPTPSTIKGYILSPQAYWYWIIMIIALVTATLIFTGSENAYPIIYVRYMLGSIFVLWLPGYSFIKALFPKEPPIPTGKKDLDSIERTVLSIVMSWALVPIAGLLLNYTPWGIRVTPITLSLLALTITFATVAVIREHHIMLGK